MKTTSDSPLSKKSRRALSEFQAIRLGEVVLRRHRAHSTKNNFSNRRPKNSRPNLSTDARLKIARASFDLRYSHQPFKAACVLSFDAQSLYRPCFERNWRTQRFVSLRAKKIRVRDARSSQIDASSEGSGLFRAPSKICNEAITIGKIGRS